MFLPRLSFLLRAAFWSVTSAILLATVPIAVDAQQSPAPAAPQPAQAQPVHLRDYSNPRSAFPHFLQPYTTQ